jgi:hypothetical protein
MPFISLRLLVRWKEQVNQGQGPVIHTAVDDLESFLWLLIWAIAHILKDKERATKNNPGIKLILENWSGKVTFMSKREIARDKWKDAVFGKVIRQWLRFFDDAEAETDTRTQAVVAQPMGSSGWKGACDELETFCKKIYEKILKSGFKHLEEIRTYPNWETVIDANVSQQVYH